MQLHACLLLLVVTTDKTLALSHHFCGGNLSLDQKPVGHISLTLPGLYPDTERLNHTDRQPDQNLSLCTWLIDLPVGGTVLLKVVKLGGGQRISVRCVWTEEDQDLVPGNGGSALLSACDRSKAALTWTGTTDSANEIQLSYYVQEGERNSSEVHATRLPGRDVVGWSETSFTRTAPVSQDVVTRKGGGRGHLYKELEQSHGPRSASAQSSQDQGPLHPTSPLQGLTVAGGGETLPLPEEGPNNGADTSGAAHLTDSPVSSRERTRLYFHTQHTLGTDASDAAFGEAAFSNELAQTQMVSTDATASDSNTKPDTDKHKYAVTHTQKHADGHAGTRAPPTLSSFSVPHLTSSHSELSSRATWGGATILITHGGATSGKKQPDSWRSQRSTDGLYSNLTSTVTSDPLKSPTEPPPDHTSSTYTDTVATASTSSTQGPGTAQSSAAHVTELRPAHPSFHPNISQTDSLESTTSDATSRTVPFQSFDQSDSTVKLHTPTTSPQSTEILAPSVYTSTPSTQTRQDMQAATQSTQRNDINASVTTSSVSSSQVDGQTSSFTSLSSTPGAAVTLGDVVHNSAETGTTAQTYTLRPAHSGTLENQPTNSPLPSTTSMQTSTPSYLLQTHASSRSTHTTPVMPSATASAVHTPLVDHKTIPTPLQTSTAKSASSLTPRTQMPLLSSTNVPDAHEPPQSLVTTTQTSPLSLTTAKSDAAGSREADKDDESWQRLPSNTAAHTPTPPSWPSPHPSPHPSLESRLTSPALTSTTSWSNVTSQTPRFYIVPDQPAAVKVESVELLLQIILEDPRSASVVHLEEDTAAWVEPYLQKAPGFSRLLGVWSSGHAVQSLVEFKTRGALQWLSITGATSLLERTGLAQAVREARSFRWSKISNITVGGLQGDVCDWLLQCPSGFKCVSQLGTANYSCSSVCRFDYCHHHGICTHHTGQLPVCRCLVGEDFWYMGQRCDVRMTRARLIGACLAILLIIVTVICILAFVAVRRYRAILIQAKVDQTRSSYRRFNHFDELSGRFWLRSWAGSADSLDNPAFTRSDELLHLRALDRPCCFHDDTLSLASTCPSHGARINTIYPHSSQYGWRGSEMSMGDGVLDSGKASDLSVCSWPVEPIQWTPFPLLQQLASHRTQTVRMSRPRSYCEGMELVDLEKSWTA